MNKFFRCDKCGKTIEMKWVYLLGDSVPHVHISLEKYDYRNTRIFDMWSIFDYDVCIDCANKIKKELDKSKILDMPFHKR